MIRRRKLTARSASATRSTARRAASTSSRRDTSKRTHSFKLGPITVAVRMTGTVPSPMRSGSFAYGYRVHVKAPNGASYSSSAWGSISDFEKKRIDFEGIGAMVVEELLSAKADPDEFLSMAGKKGRKTVNAARSFSYDELDAAVQDADRRGLR